MENSWFMMNGGGSAVAVIAARYARELLTRSPRFYGALGAGHASRPQVGYLAPLYQNIIDYGITASSVSDTTNNTVIQYFQEAGVKLRHEELNSLPTWSEIESSIGKHIVVSGLERCESYRKNVPPLRRMMGASGMFNTGTNLVTQLLKANCIIPERYAYYGPKASKE
eukprot:scaffold9591_cov54-Cyclotella_meneghiniana.AAC.4